VYAEDPFEDLSSVEESSRSHSEDQRLVEEFQGPYPEDPRLVEKMVKEHILKSRCQWRNPGDHILEAGGP
jgi:hypothetical protein